MTVIILKLIYLFNWMLLVMGFQHLALLSSDKQLSEELNLVRSSRGATTFKDIKIFMVI